MPVTKEEEPSVESRQETRVQGSVEGTRIDMTFGPNNRVQEENKVEEI